MFSSSVLSPKTVEPPPEYDPSLPFEAYPDLLKEMKFFAVNPFDRTPLTVDTLISFSYFDPETGICALSDGVWIHDDGDEYRVTVDGSQGSLNNSANANDQTNTSSTPTVDNPFANRKELAALPCDVLLAPPTIEHKDTPDCFVPPYFGITMLGSVYLFHAVMYEYKI